MERKTRKVWSIILTIAMVVTMVPILALPTVENVYADNETITEPLDFTSAEVRAAYAEGLNGVKVTGGDGSSDGSKCIVTLSGAVITYNGNSACNVINLPAYAELILEEGTESSITINSSPSTMQYVNGVGSESGGMLTISGGGTLNISENLSSKWANSYLIMPGGALTVTGGTLNLVGRSTYQIEGIRAGSSTVEISGGEINIDLGTTGSGAFGLDAIHGSGGITVTGGIINTTANGYSNSNGLGCSGKTATITGGRLSLDCSYAIGSRTTIIGSPEHPAALSNAFGRALDSVLSYADGTTLNDSYAGGYVDRIGTDPVIITFDTKCFDRGDGHGAVLPPENPSSDYFNPTKDGKTFEGWSTTPYVDEVPTEGPDFIPASPDLTLEDFGDKGYYAIFSVNGNMPITTALDFSQSATQTEYSGGKNGITWLGGAGTSSDPYKIELNNVLAEVKKAGHCINLPGSSSNYVTLVVKGENHLKLSGSYTEVAVLKTDAALTIEGDGKLYLSGEESESTYSYISGLRTGDLTIHDDVYVEAKAGRLALDPPGWTPGPESEPTQHLSPGIDAQGRITVSNGTLIGVGGTAVFKSSSTITHDDGACSIGIYSYGGYDVSGGHLIGRTESTTTAGYSIGILNARLSGTSFTGGVVEGYAEDAEILSVGLCSWYDTLNITGGSIKASCGTATKEYSAYPVNHAAIAAYEISSGGDPVVLSIGEAGNPATIIGAKNESGPYTSAEGTVDGGYLQQTGTGPVIVTFSPLLDCFDGNGAQPLPMDAAQLAAALNPTKTGQAFKGWSPVKDDITTDGAFAVDGTGTIANSVADSLVPGTAYYAVFTNASGNTVLHDGVDLRDAGVQSAYATEKNGITWTGAGTEEDPYVLTLNNATIEAEGAAYALRTPGNDTVSTKTCSTYITINLVGTNTITLNNGEVGDTDNIALNACANLTFAGNGSLEALTQGGGATGSHFNEAIRAFSITFAPGSNASVKGESSGATGNILGSYGVRAPGALNMANGTLIGIGGDGGTNVGDSVGVAANGIYVSGGTLKGTGKAGTKSGGSSMGIFATSISAITGGTVEGYAGNADSASVGIGSIAYGFEITGGELKAKAGTGSYKAAAFYGNPLTVGGITVPATITGAGELESSSGNVTDGAILQSGTDPVVISFGPSVGYTAAGEMPTMVFGTPLSAAIIGMLTATNYEGTGNPTFTCKIYDAEGEGASEVTGLGISATVASDADNSLKLTTTASTPADTYYIKVEATKGTETATKWIPVTIAAKDLTGTPTITGTAKYGEVLTANLPAEAAAGTTVAYQWLRGASAEGAFTSIAGATGAAYTLGADDYGKYVKVELTGTGNYTGTLTSAATAQVAKATDSPAPVLDTTKYTIMTDGIPVQIIDFVGEKIFYNEAVFEVSKNGTEATGEDIVAGDKLASGAAITPSESGTSNIYIRRKSAEYQDASAFTTVTIPARPAVPAEVTTTSVIKTDVTITVAAVAGQEYSIDAGSHWYSPAAGTTDVGFTGLTANTAYTIITRIKAVDSDTAKAFASLPTTGTAITTKTSGGVGPSTGAGDGNVHTVKVTADTIILNTYAPAMTNLWEYSKDGTTWQASPALAGYEPASGPHTVYVRVKDTDTTMPSAATSLSGIYTPFAVPNLSDPELYELTTVKDAGANFGKQQVTRIGGSYEMSSSESFASTVTKDDILAPDTVYYIRHKTDGTHPASAAASFKTPKIEGVKAAVTFISYNDNYGTVTVTGAAVTSSGIYDLGTVLTLIATPKEGFEFIGWTDGNPNAERTFIVAGDETVMAIFITANEHYAMIPTNMSATYTGTELSMEAIKAMYEGLEHCHFVCSQGPVKDAKTYTIQAILDDGYVWEDGTSAAKSFAFTVNKTPAGDAPTFVTSGLDNNTYTFTAVAPAALEVSKDGGAYVNKGTSVVLAPENPGTYLVRFAGDNNHNPSKATVVKVDKEEVFPGIFTDLSGTTATLTGTALTTMISYKGNEETLPYTFTGLRPGSEYTYTPINIFGVYGEPVTFRTPDTSEKVGALSLTVTNHSGELKSMVITVEQGNKIIASLEVADLADNDSRGVDFVDLPYGFYNVVLRDDECDFTDTKIVEVKDDTIIVGAFEIISGKLSTKVEVKANTPDVAVDNLNKMLTPEDKDKAKFGEISVDVKLEVEKKGSGVEGASQINALAGSGKSMDFLDMSLMKTTSFLSDGTITNAVQEDIGRENGNVLRIAIPYNTKKSGLAMYRYHDGIASKLIQLAAEPLEKFNDGTYVITDQYILLFASGFSTYAIASEGGAGGAGGGGGGGAAANVTIPTTTGGKVTADNPDAKKGEVVTITVTPNAGTSLDTLTVTDNKGKEVPVTKVNETTYTFVMPEGTVKVAATFIENSKKNPFVDVTTSDYFYDAVLWAANEGITSGTDATHFSPLNITTRGQMVTFLWRAAGCPEPVTKVCQFTDVVPGSYYEKAVLWGVENGYVKGISETLFAADLTVTRGQAMTFLARRAGITDEATGYNHHFCDVYSVDYYNNAVAWASTNGITQGVSDQYFCPDQFCRRGQIVTFLYRYLVK